MSKEWYPVVDIMECIECGTCVDFCPHGVYDKNRAPSPVVVFPEACINQCHRCSDLCPNGAISYVGDPANAKASSCGCSCGLTEAGSYEDNEKDPVDVESCVDGRIRWMKVPGEAVERLEAVASIEGGKNVSYIAAPVGGVLSERLCGEGVTVECRQVIGRITPEYRL